MKSYETSKTGVYGLLVKLSKHEYYSLPYMWLKYGGLVETHLEIVFTHTKVKIFGKELLPIIIALNDNKLSTISKEADDKIISNIIVERLDEEEFEGYVPGTE